MKPPFKRQKLTLFEELPREISVEIHDLIVIPEYKKLFKAVMEELINMTNQLYILDYEKPYSYPKNDLLCRPHRNYITKEWTMQYTHDKPSTCYCGFCKTRVTNGTWFKIIR